MNITVSKIFASLFMFITGTYCSADDKHFVAVIPSYNNEKFCYKNLEHLFSQNYTNFHAIYIDDCSNDKTSHLVTQYINENSLHDKMMLVKNPLRCGALRNIYMTIHRYCKDDDVVVIYDGDDWLATDNALSIVNKAYQETNVWTTYGNFSSTRHGLSNWCLPFENHVIQNRSYRKFAWRFGPLRTFYAWLFKQIELKDLLHEGAFYSMAGDQAFVHPLLEMADGRFKYIPDVLYIYNEHNPINDWIVNGTLQHSLRDKILAKQPYKALKHKPSSSDTTPSIYTINIQNSDAVKYLLADENIAHHDMCLFIDEADKTLVPPNVLKEHTQLLQKMHGAIVTYARYTNKSMPPQQIEHTSYLWNTIFTFQLGWKPQLAHAYQEYAWLIPTQICREHPSFVTELIRERSSFFKPKNKTLIQQAGLLVITE